MDETTISFGYWVRRQRRALDLTQRALAECVGCAVATIKKIEADERRPSAQMAERLAACLGPGIIGVVGQLRRVAGDRVQAVRPDPLVFAVDKSGNGAVVIQWDAPTGTLFAGAGIVVDGQRDPKTARLNREQNQVVKCHVTGNGRQAQCTNVRSQPGTFKYTVLLQRDGKAFPPFDPEIVNKE